MNEGIVRALNKLAYAYDTFFYQFADWEKDDKFCELFRKKLKSYDFFLDLTFNFLRFVLYNKKESIL